MIKTEQFSYDPVGSMSLDHTYLNTGEGDTVLYSNNDDSRLNSVLGTSGSFGDYAYDHLGQRVLKLELGYTIFIYDIFGNLISEFDPDGNNIRDWVYLGNHRLALIQLSQPHGPGFPGCQGLPEPPDICGLAGLGDGVALNWVIIALGPFGICQAFWDTANPNLLYNSTDCSGFLGELIQTLVGNCGGLGDFLTNRSGCFRYAVSKVCCLSRITCSALP